MVRTSIYIVWVRKRGGKISFDMENVLKTLNVTKHKPRTEYVPNYADNLILCNLSKLEEKILSGVTTRTT